VTYIIQLIVFQLNLYKPGSFAGIRTYSFILKHICSSVKKFLKNKCKDLLIFLFIFSHFALFIAENSRKSPDFAVLIITYPVLKD